MSQRLSGYARKERDQYETPGWVTETLLPHLPPEMVVWECAAGSGKIVDVLRHAGYPVHASDITEGSDFLKSTEAEEDAIVTNPPYELAREFVEHALQLMHPRRGLVAMLLRTDFDHAKTRQHLFAECPAFAKKLVLTKRIVWFDGPKAAPSFNHAWFLWNWQHSGAPILTYGPRLAGAA